MVAAIWAAPRAVELAESIRNTIVPEIHGRLVESYAVPAAMQAVLLHGRDVTREVAVETLRRMIGGRAALIGQGERDEVRLLRDILSSTVRVAEPGPGGNGTVQVERTVGQILGTAIRPNGRPVLATPNSAALTTVAAMGIRICKHHGSDQQRLFIADDVVQRRLLRDTRWAQSRIDQILSRLAGAERDQQRLDGTVRTRGLSLPWPGCLTELGGCDSDCDNVNPENTGVRAINSYLSQCHSRNIDIYRNRNKPVSGPFYCAFLYVSLSRNCDWDIVTNLTALLSLSGARGRFCPAPPAVDRGRQPLAPAICET